MNSRTVVTLVLCIFSIAPSGCADRTSSWTLVRSKAQCKKEGEQRAHQRQRRKERKQRKREYERAGMVFLDPLILARGEKELFEHIARLEKWNERTIDPFTQVMFEWDDGVRKSALYAAVFYGTVGYAQKLLEAQANPNECVENRTSLLHMACSKYRGNPHMIELLLSYGARPWHLNALGTLPEDCIRVDDTPLFPAHTSYSERLRLLMAQQDIEQEEEWRQEREQGKVLVKKSETHPPLSKLESPDSSSREDTGLKRDTLKKFEALSLTQHHPGNQHSGYTPPSSSDFDEYTPPSSPDQLKRYKESTQFGKTAIGRYTAAFEWKAAFKWD